MLWPDDPEYRQKVIGQSLTLRALELREALSRENAIRLVEGSVDLPAMQEIQEQAEQRHLHGSIAGSILVDCAGTRHAGLEGYTKKVVVDRLCETVSKHGTEWRQAHIAPQTVYNTIWPRFGPVAHYWAAHRERARSGDDTFPCEIGRVEMFLGEVKAWRDLGQKTKYFQSNKWILPPGFAAAVPGEDRLPTVELSFLPV